MKRRKFLQLLGAVTIVPAAQVRAGGRMMELVAAGKRRALTRAEKRELQALFLRLAQQDARVMAA